MNNNSVQALNYDNQELRLEIHTAQTVEDHYLEEIARLLMKKYNFVAKEIINVIDPDLIGGVKVIIDTKVIDSSLRGQIENIQKQMIKKGYED